MIKTTIFDDMLEITSAGALPDSIAPEALGTGRSEIRNRVLAPVFKNLGLIESWGTGIQRIRREVEEHGHVNLVLQEVGNAFQVQFVKKVVTTEVTPEVTPEARVVAVLEDDMTKQQLMSCLEMLDDKHFRTVYLTPAIEAGLIERTIPDKPRSSKLKYRLTDRGRKARRGMVDMI